MEVFSYKRWRAGFAMGMLLAASAGSAQAAQVLQVGCSTSPRMFNTGYDAATGGKLTGGIDPTWDVSAPMESTNPLLPPDGPLPTVYNDATIGKLAPAWDASPFGASEWISSRNQGNSVQGDWFYRARFEMDPAVSPSSFKLDLSFIADNSVANIWVNGTQVPGPAVPVGVDPYYHAGYLYANRAQMQLASPTVTWKGAGQVNEIVVQIKSAPDAEGFLAEASTANVCPLNTPQIQIEKTASTSTAVPGDTVVYTVVVSNGGTLAANATLISDPLPAGLTNASWTCTAGAGAACGAPTGQGSLQDTADLPIDGKLTYTVTATMGAGAAGPVTNIASAVPPSGSLCAPWNSAPPCLDSATVQRQMAEVLVAKTASVASAKQGDPVSFSINVSNTGSAPAGGTVVSDPVPAGLAGMSWSCVGSNGAQCGAASGTGAVQDTVAALPVGGALVYTVLGTLDAGTGPLTNAVSVTPPAGSVCAPTSDAPPCLAIATVQRLQALLQVTKTASVASAKQGDPVSFSINVSNTGSAPAGGTVVSDPVPAGLAGASWTCVGSNGAQCGVASGTGAIQDTVGSLPPGAALTYTLQATVEAGTDPVTNTVSVASEADNLCAPASTAPPCLAQATVLRGAIAEVAVTPVPTLGQWMLALLALLLGAGAMVQLRRR